MCKQEKRILRVSELEEKVPAWTLTGDYDGERSYVQCRTALLNRKQRKFFKEEFNAKEVVVKENIVRFILPSDVEIVYDINE